MTTFLEAWGTSKWSGVRWWARNIVWLLILGKCRAWNSSVKSNTVFSRFDRNLWRRNLLVIYPQQSVDFSLLLSLHQLCITPDLLPFHIYYWKWPIGLRHKLYISMHWPPVPLLVHFYNLTLHPFWIKKGFSIPCMHTMCIWENHYIIVFNEIENYVLHAVEHDILYFI